MCELAVCEQNSILYEMGKFEYGRSISVSTMEAAFAATLKSIYESGIGDVRIISSDGIRFMVQSSVICVKGSIFEDLMHKWEEAEDRTIPVQYTREQLDRFLRYVYYRDLPSDTLVETFFDIYRMVDFFQMSQLRDEMIEVFSKKIAEKDLNNAALLASKYASDTSMVGSVAKKIASYIKDNKRKFCEGYYYAYTPCCSHHEGFCYGNSESKVHVNTCCKTPKILDLKDVREYSVELKDSIITELTMKDYTNSKYH